MLQLAAVLSGVKKPFHHWKGSTKTNCLNKVSGTKLITIRNTENRRTTVLLKPFPFCFKANLHHLHPGRKRLQFLGIQHFWCNKSFRFCCPCCKAKSLRVFLNGNPEVVQFINIITFSISSPVRTECECMISLLFRAEADKRLIVHKCRVFQSVRSITNRVPPGCRPGGAGIEEKIACFVTCKPYPWPVGNRESKFNPAGFDYCKIRCTLISLPFLRLSVSPIILSHD